MAVPNDGSQQLPRDSASKPFFGLWDAANSVFRAWAAVPGLRQAIVTLFNSSGVEVGTTTNPIRVAQASYTVPLNGELAGATSATQMPNVPCSLIKFKASYDNVGRAYIGGPGVTKADGATDTTTGIQLNASEETGWIPVDNANRLYRICDNVGDDLTYIALS